MRGSGRGAAATLLARVSDVGATYGYYAVLARALPVEHFGLFVLATTVLQFATALARRGLDQVVVALPPSGGVNRFVAGWIALVGIAIAIGSAIVIYVADLPPFGYWFAAAVPLVALGQLVINALRARANVTLAAIVEGTVQPVSSLAGVAIVAATAPSLENFAAAFVTSWVITLFFAVAVEWAGPPMDEESAARLHGRGHAMFGVFLLHQAAVAADVLLLGLLASPIDVARYAAALKIAAALDLLQSAVTSTATPFIQRAAHDRALLAEYVAVVTRWALIVCLPLLAITIGAPAFLLKLAFGAEYAASATVLVILSIARMAPVMSGPGGSVMLCTGHEKIYFRTQLAGTAILILLIAAVANSGATAVAIAVLVGAYINRGLLLIMMRRFAGVTPWERPLVRLAF